MGPRRRRPVSVASSGVDESELIGQKVTVLGMSLAGDRVSIDNEAVAHICLVLEDGQRVFVQAADPDVTLELVEG